MIICGCICKHHIKKKYDKNKEMGIVIDNGLLDTIAEGTEMVTIPTHDSNDIDTHQWKYRTLSGTNYFNKESLEFEDAYYDENDDNNDDI